MPPPQIHTFCTPLPPEQALEAAKADKERKAANKRGPALSAGPSSVLQEAAAAAADAGGCKRAGGLAVGENDGVQRREGDGPSGSAAAGSRSRSTDGEAGPSGSAVAGAPISGSGAAGWSGSRSVTDVEAGPSGLRTSPEEQEGSDVAAALARVIGRKTVKWCEQVGGSRSAGGWGRGEAARYCRTLCACVELSSAH